MSITDYLNSFDGWSANIDNAKLKATEYSTIAMREFVDRTGTISQAAEVLGVSPSCVSHILKGKRRMSARVANRIRFMSQ